ncbi:MAG TPA: proton-conducting transporter membrane subunit, partial [Acidimicrobiales bacterium]|nr:proton-conducting transporter membrane subunit [Acidimicrobiales bacterium]
MGLLLGAFLVVGLGLLVAGGRLGPRAFVVGTAPFVLTVTWLVSRTGQVVDGRPVEEAATWVGGLDLVAHLRLDGLALTMSLIVSIVGVAVLLYASRYFAADAPDLGRLAGLLVLFGGSMLGLVQADHLLMLYACWELTSITSFLLIGNRHTESRARAAALHALLVTSAGGLALLAGLVILGQQAGTYRLSGILDHGATSGAAATVAVVLVFVGAATKSAQYPFHAWLPGAMAAPTPVSAYLHSATMVKAGVFLVARLAPVFAATMVWRPMVLGVGCATMVFGGLRALRQHDLKLLLAFGTVSQLGLLVVLFGAGTPAATTAGWALLVAHAAFKATLFMVVGVIDHQTGTRDIRHLPPLAAGWRPIEVVTVLAAASMAGVPLGAGFIAKELAYDAFADGPFAASAIVLTVVVGGSMLTVAYAARFWWGAFVSPRRRATVDVVPDAPPPAAFVAPAAVLAVVGVVLGIAPGLGDGLATASVAGSTDVHLSLWHGLGLPLLLSAVTLAGGALLATGDRVVQSVLARGRGLPSGAEIYLSVLRVVGVVSTRITGVVQSGSLPVYAGVILTTFALSAGIALVVGDTWEGWPRLGTASEAAIASAIVVAALGASIVRRRFAAALFLSAVGYAMAGLFVLSGAPDLALTQVAVETLSTV